MQMQEDKKIKIIGIGAGGTHIINDILSKDLNNVEFWVINTDKQILESSKIPNKIQLGKNVANGLGCGGAISKGRLSAEKSKEEIEIALNGADIVFIISCLGGGTGGGATPVVTEIAKNLDITTISIIIKPFVFEGSTRLNKANQAIEDIQENSDCTFIIDNEKITDRIKGKSSLKEAFSIINDYIFKLLKLFCDVTPETVLINIEYKDIDKIFNYSSQANFYFGCAKGENRAINAANFALESSLCDEILASDIKNLIINIQASPDINLSEVNDIVATVSKKIPEDTAIVLGCTIDNNKNDEIEVSIITCV